MKRRNKSAFDRCVESVAARGSAADPRAVCYTAGVKKYGKAEMTRRAIAGKKRAARRGNAPRVTQREVDSAAASYHNMLMQYGENNMATQRAEFKYRDLQRAYAEQKAKRATRGNAGRPDYKSQMDALSQQIDQAMQERDFKRVRDLQTKIQHLYSKSVGGLRKGAARYRGSRGNPRTPKLSLVQIQDRYIEELQAAYSRWGHRRGIPGIAGGVGGQFPRRRRAAYKKAQKDLMAWGLTREQTADALRQADDMFDLERRSENRGNPAEAARAVSEEFHGRKVREMVPVTERRHYHKFLAELGELTLLVIHTPDGRHKVELTQFAGALLCTNEDKNQLFIKGGDQTVNLRDFGVRDPHEKEHLGELRKIAYFTDKEHLGDEGGEADYHHSFSKPYPHVDFRTRDTHLEISGGRYKITREGIVG